MISRSALQPRCRADASGGDCRQGEFECGGVSSDYFETWRILVGTRKLLCVDAHLKLLRCESGSLFVSQGGSDRIEIGQNGRPALLTEHLNRGALSGLPSRTKFLDLLAAFGGKR